MPQRGKICLCLALNQLSFPFIIILNQYCRCSSSRYCDRTGNPEVSQSKDSKEDAECPRAGGAFSQSWTLPDAKHLGLGYSLKWKQPMFSEEPPFPILLIAWPVSKVTFLLTPDSLHFFTNLFVFASHLLSWFPVSPSCLKCLLFWVKLFFHVVGHNLKIISSCFAFRKLTYLSLKNTISPRKVVTASKVKLRPQVFVSAGSFGSVVSSISADSLWSLWVLEDGPKINSLWKKLEWELIQVYSVQKKVCCWKAFKNLWNYKH